MADERPSFVAHTQCPAHLRKRVEDYADSLPQAWLLPPQAGEVFDQAQDCLARLQGYAFTRGFAVVTTTSKKGRAQFACIHHGQETKDWRHLSEEDRQRHNHTLNQKDCPWAVYWSVRSVGRRGSGILAGQLGITRLDHNHGPAPNPLIFKQHEKATPGYQQALERALGHRLAHQPYAAMQRVLSTAGLRINRKTYYNLCNKPLERSADSFEGLVFSLEDSGFRFTYRMVDELAEDQTVKA